MGATSWLLGIDESGGFGAEDGAGLVAGVLLRLDDHPADREALRQAIQRELPGVPWPPHATDLRLPVTHLLGWLLPRRGPPPSAYSEDRARCSDGLELLRRSKDPALARARQSAEQGDWDAIPLRGADASLKAASRSLWDDLADLAAERRARIGRLLAKVRRTLGAEGCFAVVAAGPHDGLSLPIPGGIGRDRYLELLEVLFERLLLLRGGTPATLTARVATRNIPEQLGTLRGFSLRAQDWLALFERAARRVRERHPEAAPIRVLAPEIVTRYDHRAHPCVVLADFLANSTLGGLRSGTSLQFAGHHVLQATGLGLAATSNLVPGRGRLPSLTAGGPFREAVAAAGRGDPPEPLPPRPRWAAEEAGQWIEALGGGRP